MLKVKDKAVAWFWRSFFYKFYQCLFLNLAIYFKISILQIYLRLPSMTEKTWRRVQNSYTVAKSFTQVNVSETWKLHRDFPLSLGRGKKYNPWSLKVKNSQCYCHFTKTKLAPNWSKMKREEYLVSALKESFQIISKTSLKDKLKNNDFIRLFNQFPLTIMQNIFLVFLVKIDCCICYTSEPRGQSFPADCKAAMKTQNMYSQKWSTKEALPWKGQ